MALYYQLELSSSVTVAIHYYHHHITYSNKTNIADRSSNSGRYGRYIRSNFVL